MSVAFPHALARTFVGGFSIAAGSERRPQELDPIGPVALADLALASTLIGGARVVTLEARGSRCSFVASGGGGTALRFDVPPDIGHAAAVRLVLLAGLDPSADARTSEGRRNVARVTVSTAGQRGQVSISSHATSLGIDVEVLSLAANERFGRGGPLRRCASCGVYQSARRDACEHDGGALLDVVDRAAPGGTVGPYLVHELLGRGSMGAVFAGEHALIGKPVAIKVLHRSLAEDPAVARRFLTEARAASRLRHPNVVEVTDYGLLDDGYPFMVMERLMGESVEDRLVRETVLPPLAALLIARAVADALAAAHEAGVLHNDLKCANVLLL
ncbi:MAG: protein kinase, partial [Minicystis sp.]